VIDRWHLDDIFEIPKAGLHRVQFLVGAHSLGCVDIFVIGFEDVLALMERFRPHVFGVFTETKLTGAWHFIRIVTIAMATPPAAWALSVVSISRLPASLSVLTARLA